MAVTTRKGGPIGKTKRRYAVEKIAEMIQTGEIVKYNNIELGIQLNISNNTIPKLIKEARLKIEPLSIEQCHEEFRDIFEFVLDNTRKMYEEAKTPSDKEKVSRLFLHLIKEKTDFLERFFVKPKAQENVHVEGEIDNKFTLEIIDNTKVVDMK